MRLIDADTLIEEIKGMFCPDGYKLDFIRKIDNAPTVELKDIYQEGHYDGHLEGYTKAINEERPQGEWIYLDKEDVMKVECPFCHNRQCCISNYCDYCGADMRGGKE